MLIRVGEGAMVRVSNHILRECICLGIPSDTGAIPALVACAAHSSILRPLTLSIVYKQWNGEEYATVLHQYIHQLTECISERMNSCRLVEGSEANLQTSSLPLLIMRVLLLP